ncbi:MAG: hypothetical protein SFZ03_09050 [Candidatus Melainabacteria bacterium]|nr:hypothetical protein [Candidatus Melainabacteria bacterium]
MSVPVCPILSVRNSEGLNELCLQETCALYLPAAKKCSLVYIGLHALMEVQRLQPAPSSQPSAAKPTA